MKNVFYLSLALVGLTFGLIACGEDDGGTTPPPAATWAGTYPGNFSGYAVLGLDTTPERITSAIKVFPETSPDPSTKTPGIGTPAAC